jgi:predicted metal-dependent hydrolase
MKKLLVSVFVLVALTITQAFAYELRDFSSDAKIIAAMQLLEQTGNSDVFANMKKNAVKVKFYNLSGYGNVYATNSYDNTGRRVILINSVYQNAPAEQIACLIAHESMHVLRKATMEEETIATQKEAATWMRLKNKSVTYPQNKLTKRLDQLAQLQTASNNDGTNYIKTKIASSSFYKAQFGM